MGIEYRVIIIFICVSLFLTSCTALNLAGKAVGTAAKVTVATVKTTGKVLGATAKATAKGVKTVVNMASGKHIVKLTKKGNSLLVDTLLNRKVKTRLILDTGCTDTQISREIAAELGLTTYKSKTVQCQLADGRTVTGREVTIKEIRVGKVRVNNVRAIVLDSGAASHNGLLGMSFLDNFVFRVDSEKPELILQRRI